MLTNKLMQKSDLCITKIYFETLGMVKIEKEV